MDFENKNTQIILGAVVGVLILILLIGVLTSGPRKRAQVTDLRSTMSKLNQAVVIQNRITNGTMANKDKQQLVNVFATRLKAKKKGEDFFILKDGTAVIIKDVNPNCKADGSDKCADMLIKTKGKRSTNKISTAKKLTGTYAVELRAKRVYASKDTEDVIRKIR